VTPGPDHPATDPGTDPGTDPDDAPPARVRVTSPRTSGARPRTRSAAQEIDAQTAVGEVYLRALVRSQLRIAVTVVVTLVLTVGVVPLVFWVSPDLARVDVAGVPLVWAVLGFGVYPLLVLAGWLLVRQAERNERAFADLVERP